MKRLIILLFIITSISVVSKAQTFYSDDSEATQAHIHYIQSFLDAYKQAYAKQNLPFIEMVFSEDAIIITETMELLKSTTKPGGRIKKDRKYRTMVEDKKQYLERLKSIFKKGPILLDMADVKIQQHNRRPYLFGVNFTQAWYSDSQNELEEKYPGYVFLMIDFKNDVDNPIIHVKTWQPVANVESKELDVYYLYDFQLFD